MKFYPYDGRLKRLFDDMVEIASFIVEEKALFNLRRDLHEQYYELKNIWESLPSELKKRLAKIYKEARKNYDSAVRSKQNQEKFLITAEELCLAAATIFGLCSPARELMKDRIEFRKSEDEHQKMEKRGILSDIETIRKIKRV